MTRKYYDWQSTFSRQTGSQGEFCIVVGAKNIGKTFGIRKQCINDFIKKGDKFCEICRTKDEKKQVVKGYFDKFSELGFFEGYIFKTNSNEGFIAKEPECNPETNEYINKPDWQQCCYFISLTTFQTEKKRTYSNIKRFIFDEAIIDNKDRYHHYLNQEYLILANILDSVSRQQPKGEQYRVYILGNACDLTCPYMRYLGINKIPEFGYSFWNKKHTLLHYVKPWDAREMKEQTLVGRMLNGLDEASMVYDNVFSIRETGDIEKKTKSAKFTFGIKYTNNIFGIWFDYAKGLAYINNKIPKGGEPIFALTKNDQTIDFMAVEKTSEYLKSLNRFFYAGLLRYDNLVTRDLFLNVLNFLGVK